MSEPCFTSKFSLKQIEKNFESVDIFEALMEGLREVYACEMGDAAPGTIVHERTEEEIDAATANEAYDNYLKSGEKSRPISELWEELDL